MPKVSIIVINYNYSRFLDDCLTSIRNQTFIDYELIFVDDGSTEEWLPIVTKYHPDQIIANDHQGVVLTRIDAVKASSGEYVCFIDADDKIAPDYIEKCVETLDSDSQIAIAYTDCHKFDENKDDLIEFREYNQLYLQKGNYILGSALFRRKAYNEVGGYDKQLEKFEDYDLWLSITDAGWLAKRVPGFKYYYREHANSYTHGWNVQECFEKIWTKHNAGKKIHVLAEICTKNRYYTTLPLAIMSVIMQTRLPDQLLIIDDSDNIEDLRNISVYQHLFNLLEDKKIPWSVEFGSKRGPQFNHERAQELATQYVWRLDDDVYANSDVLELLLASMKNDVGAVGGSILTTPVAEYCPVASNKIEDFKWAPNKQFFKNPTTEVDFIDHLHCSFLYRKGITHYDLNLSPVGHTEETLFSFGIRKKDFKVLFDPKAITWHLRDPQGGIRTQTNPQLWFNDEAYFYNKLKEWGIQFSNTFFWQLDNGIGDHFEFKKLIPSLKKKYSRIILAVCYPDVFSDDGIELISIAQARVMTGDGLHFNVYKWMLDNNWNKPIVEAYKQMSGVTDEL